MSGVFSLDGHFSDPWRIRLSQEVKQMERKRFARLSQRLGALLLAGVTLWTVYATAGSVDAAGAWMAVKRELPLALLQWQLGDMGQRDGLSAPSVLMLSQAPILLSARGEISDLRRQAAEEPEDERPAPVTQPVREESQPAPVTAGADNGVTAKTLIPTDPSGYHRLREGLHPKHHPIYPLQRGAAEALRGGADRRSAADPDSAQPRQRGLYPGGG